MGKLTTITPKFQVHIPISIREELGLKTHGKALIRTEGSRIIIEPVGKTFLSLGGLLRFPALHPPRKYESTLITPVQSPKLLE